MDLVRQRLERHLALGKARGARVHRLAVDADHALLARVRVDAGEPNRERRIAMHADPAQPVEHRLALLERHLVVLVAAVLARRSAPHLQPSLQAAAPPPPAENPGAPASRSPSAEKRGADVHPGFRYERRAPPATHPPPP